MRDPNDYYPRLHLIDQQKGCGKLSELVAPDDRLFGEGRALGEQQQ